MSTEEKFPVYNCKVEPERIWVHGNGKWYALRCTDDTKRLAQLVISGSVYRNTSRNLYMVWGSEVTANDFLFNLTKYCIEIVGETIPYREVP